MRGLPQGINPFETPVGVKPVLPVQSANAFEVGHCNLAEHFHQRVLAAHEGRLRHPLPFATSHVVDDQIPRPLQSASDDCPVLLLVRSDGRMAEWVGTVGSDEHVRTP